MTTIDACTLCKRALNRDANELRVTLKVVKGERASLQEALKVERRLRLAAEAKLHQQEGVLRLAEGLHAFDKAVPEEKPKRRWWRFW